MSTELPTPTDDEREALKSLIYTYETIDFAESQNFTTRDCYGVVDKILAAGFRRQPPTTSPALPTREALMTVIERAFAADSRGDGSGRIEDDITDDVLDLMKGETR